MATASKQPELFGYPTGLFNLFFAEMWERFSYYGMRALLVFYMIKGFLGYNDGEAYTVYGAYTALVYMTPFFGGMLADRLLGARRAVVFGGLLMASGHLLMTLESGPAFFAALALLIVGNGFFKPNVSTMVGALYEDGDPRRDGGFTLFYIGINLGAAMAPLLCGYVGETYGWHYGFGLATIGMLTGLAVFIVPNMVAQGLILSTALITAASMVIVPEGALLVAVNGFVALALVASGISAFIALGRGGLSKEAGAAKHEGVLPMEWAVYFGTLLVVPLLGVLVWSSRTVKLVPDALMARFEGSDSAGLELVGFLLHKVSTPPGLLLAVVGILATGYLLIEAFRSDKVERERLFAVLIMMVFSMLFWAFFEQAGSSVSNFTDRNIDRVFQERTVTDADVGHTLQIKINQEQLGYPIGDSSIKSVVKAQLREDHEKRTKMLSGEVLEERVVDFNATMASLDREDRFTLTSLDALASAKGLDREWVVSKEHVGMGINGSVVPASTFQSANPIYIMIFGLIFSGLWTYLGKRGVEPSTPVKFGLGLLQLGLGFVMMWYGASIADERGMAGMSWVLMGYLLHTTGELCLSPVGLSMVTRLSPKRLVSTVMGAWFLATAFSNYLAAVIAALTGVSHGEGGGSFIPVPTETVAIYGGVFGQIAIAAILSSVAMFALSPLLNKWMHEDLLGPDSGGGH